MIQPMEPGSFLDRTAKWVADFTGTPQTYGRAVVTHAIIVVVFLGAINVLTTMWQTSQLRDDAAASRAAYKAYRDKFLCQQDRNYKAIMGARGLDHMCDNAGK